MTQYMEIVNEYEKALRTGKKEYSAAIAQNKEPYPTVMELLPEYTGGYATKSIGLIDIPVSEVAGVRSIGRQEAFSSAFRPLMEVESEFAQKWMALCEAHLGETGIRDPITCCEFYGKFYLVEGNKRFSVLSWFGASYVQAEVTRIIPETADTDAYKVYQEFLQFFEVTRMYDVRCTKAGFYKKLLTDLKRSPEQWTDDDRRFFRARFTRFRDALQGIKLPEGVTTGDALVIFLRYHSVEDLWNCSAAELKKMIAAVQGDIRAASNPEPVAVRVEASTIQRESIVTQLLGGSTLRATFIHEKDCDLSPWTRNHELGRQYAQEQLGSRVKTSAVFHAVPGPECEELIEQEIKKGTDVIFTTTPTLIGAARHSAVRHPEVVFLNCSVNMPYSDVRTYYTRMYEGKFITGAIAGALSEDGRIGYSATYPIYGVPAGINAFALGARMVNPNAKIVLDWASLRGDSVARLLDRGISLISARDNPTPESIHPFCGLFQYKNGEYTSYAAPVWDWGMLYVTILRTLLTGGYRTDGVQAGSRAVNYWWGMDTGAIDVLLEDTLPEGIKALSDILKNGIVNHTVDPFKRTLIAQNGTCMNDGLKSLSTTELLKMDWLCDAVEGYIPDFDELIPIGKRLYRHLGLHRESLEEQVI